jgi:NitT/TauT family transport system ATP-binding protein
VRSVTKEFVARRARHVALEDVSLEVDRQEVVGIVGPTGCGKTTLLNMLAGFLFPTRGQICVGGGAVTGPGPDRGFIFQQANVFPWLTVRANVMFAAQFGRDLVAPGLGHGSLLEAVDYYLTAVGLKDAANLYPYQISGGMKSRAALARVLLTNPSVLLMDEPFAALDAQTRAQMHRLLLRLFSFDTMRTVVLITHDVEEALILCDRIYVLSSGPGRIVAEYRVDLGRPREYSEIARRPDFVDLKFEILGRLERFWE